jgi:hypothetical protein
VDGTTPTNISDYIDLVVVVYRRGNETA